MIVEARLRYTAQIARRGRTALAEGVRLVAHEIREAEAGSAPVAFWWGRPAEREAARLLEGRLYVPLRQYRHDGARPPAPDDRFMRDPGVRCLSIEAFRQGLAAGRLGDDTRLLAVRDPEIADDLEARAAAVGAEMARHVAIDGAVHRLVRYPVAMVGARCVDSGSSKFVAARMQFLHADTLDGLDFPHLEFRLDRYDDALSLLRGLEAPAAALAEAEAGRPEILLPEAVEFDEERRLVERCAQRVIVRVARFPKIFQELDDDSILAYVALRDALDADDMATVERSLRTLSRTAAEGRAEVRLLDKTALSLALALARLDRERAAAALDGEDARGLGGIF